MVLLARAARTLPIGTAYAVWVGIGVVGAVLGLVMMIVGVVISLTVVGAIVGIPLAIFGFLLILRSLF